MGVSVTVYYKGGPERRDELSQTLARIRRRIDALTEGRKLTVAEERAGKVVDRIKEMDASATSDAMQSKFHQDMRALVASCSDAIPGSVSVEYREPDATTPGSLVWLFRGDRNGTDTVGRAMEAAGLHRTDSRTLGAVAARYDFAMGDLDAAGCNRIRLATEEAARALWEEYGGKKAEHQIGGSVHADERQVPSKGINPYGVIRAAARAVAGVRRAGEGRGWTSRRAGGLRLGSGEWLTPDAELVIWMRETMKWINREGQTDRDELEAQIGARVGNEPSGDTALFDQTARAITEASLGRFDGESLTPMKEEE